MAKIIRENHAGCWFDGSHQSAETLNLKIVETMNIVLVMAGMPTFPIESEDEFFYMVAEDAISFVNWQICGNGDYSESPELIFEIEDNSLFLTKATQEN